MGINDEERKLNNGFWESRDFRHPPKASANVAVIQAQSFPLKEETSPPSLSLILPCKFAQCLST